MLGQESPAQVSASESLCVAAMMILSVSSCRLFIGPLYLAGLQFPGRAASPATGVSGALGSPEGHWEGCDPAGPPAQLPREGGISVSVSQRGVMSYWSANRRVTNVAAVAQHDG